MSAQANTWRDYESGLFPPSGCNEASTDIDYVVQLVGYGTDSTTGKVQPACRGALAHACTAVTDRCSHCPKLAGQLDD